MSNYNTSKARLRYKIREAMGNCVRCGDKLPSGSIRKKCTFCLEYCRKVRNRRDRYLHDHLYCIQCKKLLDTPRSAWHCQICLDKANQSGRLKRAKERLGSAQIK